MKTELITCGEVSDNQSVLPLDDLTSLANRYLQTKDYSKAYPYVARLAEVKRDNPRTSVVAGLVALELDHREQAAIHFKEALGACPDDYDANYNLALMEIQAGELNPALWRLRRLARLNPEDTGLYNDMAILWMNRNRNARAEVNFYRALRGNPNYSQARNNAMQFFLEKGLIDRGKKLLAFQEKNDSLTPVSCAEVRRWKEVLEQAQSSVSDVVVEEVRPDTGPVAPKGSPRIGKVAVFASHQAFVKDIVKGLAEVNEVKLFEGTTVDQISDLMAWADVAFFEWCDNLVIEATKLPKRCKIVCRLHSYEAFTDMPARVDWNKVDHLIFVNDSVRNLVQQRVKDSVATSVIHNGVDLDRFSIPEDKRYGKRIASVGYINYKKNPPLLLYCFKKIHEYDPEYTLHIAGAHQDPRIALYFEHFLRQNPLPIHFDGWVDDMAQWYADKDFVISTSLFESFHYSIAEGMASGLMPLIHNWYGADNLYPQDFFFDDPDQCLDLLVRLKERDRHALAVENREYISRRFDQKKKLSEIMTLLHSLTRQPAEA